MATVANEHMNHTVNTVQKLQPGDVRIVNINGRPTTLVIGRKYEFKLKEGARATPLRADE